jgi:hypothetical protein
MFFRCFDTLRSPDSHVTVNCGQEKMKSAFRRPRDEQDYRADTTDLISKLVHFLRNFHDFIPNSLKMREKHPQKQSPIAILLLGSAKMVIAGRDCHGRQIQSKTRPAF